MLFMCFPQKMTGILFIHPAYFNYYEVKLLVDTARNFMGFKFHLFIDTMFILCCG